MTNLQEYETENKNKIKIDPMNRTKNQLHLKNVLFNATQFEVQSKVIHPKGRFLSKNSYDGYVKRNSIKQNKNFLKNLKDLTKIIN